MSTKILIIDHNDSFTFNLVQLLEEAGAESVTVKLYQNFEEADMERADAIVLSPGPGLPAEYPKTFVALQKYAASKPILGVCLGLQIMVEYFGGALYNLSQVKHGRKAPVFIQQQTPLFAKIASPFYVGLYHSWAMDKNTLPYELQITATLADHTVMSIQHSRLNIQAVQFHPESYMTENGLLMMQNWLNLVENAHVR